MYEDLQRPSYKRAFKVVLRTTLVCLALYLLAGIFGYLGFADWDRGEYLSNSSLSGMILMADYDGAKEVAMGLLFIGLSIGFAMPLSLVPARKSLQDLLYPEEEDPSTLKHVILTLAITLVSLFSGMFISSMAQAVTLIGAALAPLVLISDVLRIPRVLLHSGLRAQGLH
jgi:hypothetical protein